MAWKPVPSSLLRPLATGFCCLLILAACNSRDNPGENGRQRVLTDQAGHVLRLPERVSRVGTPGISMASLILALGGRQRLIAVAPEVRANPWLQRIAPELANIPTPFVRPSGMHLEQLLAVKPDLVTLWLGRQSQGSRLEALGIPVLYMGYRNAEEMREAALLLGTALGPQALERARAFVDYYDAGLNLVDRGLKGLGKQDRPRIYYASISPLQTEGRDSMVDAWISRAGGLNVAASALKGDGTVHMEDLYAWDPDLIITLEPEVRQAMLKDPRWQKLRAVAAGRVYVNPRGINAWCTRAAETALQVRWAAQLFHPERFAQLDMGRETRHFYQQFYDYTLNDDELARVLRGAPPSDDNRHGVFQP